MVECARRLSTGWPFARPDFYEVDGRTVFSELTLHPGAGTNRFTPAAYDRYWGDALQLPRPSGGGPGIAVRWRRSNADAVCRRR